MNKKHAIFSIIVLWLAIVNCNVPQGQTTQESFSTATADLAGTITAMAALQLATDTDTPTEATLQVTGTITSSPTTCVPTIVANSPINVRSGPGTAYPAIGSLPKGGSSGVAGKSEDGTWWYIDFPAGEGGHAWVSKNVVTASCIPSTLASIAAPPLPATQPPTYVPGSNESDVPTHVGPTWVGPTLAGPGPTSVVPTLAK